MLTPEEKKKWEDRIKSFSTANECHDTSQKVPWEVADLLLLRIKQLSSGKNAHHLPEQVSEMYDQAFSMAMHMKAIGIFDELNPPQDAREWALSYRNSLRQD